MSARTFLREARHTGFVAWMSDGTVVSDEDVGGLRSNWSSVDKDSIILLEIWWKGDRKGSLSGPFSEGGRMLYYRTAVTSLCPLGQMTSRVASRSIGRSSGSSIDRLITVSEATGNIWS